MDVVLFGASGMVGQGVLRECLGASDVGEVLAVVRKPLPVSHPKLRQMVRADLFDYADVTPRFQRYDACFFCLGASAAEVGEAEYAHLNFDLPLAAARAMSQANPGMDFIYVSGAGTDASERGKVMWARVKGRTENALQRLPFRNVFLFRPGIIQPAHGEVSKTRAYRLFYAATGWLLPLLRKLLPNTVLSTEQMGRAMLNAVRRNARAGVQEIRDIAALAAM